MLSEQEQFQRQSVRHFKIGLVFLYSFALLYSLGPFFAWLLLAGVLYGFAFAIYYRNLSPPKVESNQDEWSNPGEESAEVGSVNQESIKKILRFVPLILGSVVIIGAVTIIFSTDNKPADEQDTSQTNEISLTEKLRQDPKDVEALVNLGNEYYNTNQHDSALFYYNQALKIKPDYKEACYNIALDYYSQAKYSEAISAIDKCLQQHPEYGEAWQLKGDCTYYLKKEDDALILYEKAYSMGTRNAYLSHMLAYLYDVRNNTSKAIEFYKEAIQQDSSKVEVYKRLAELVPEKAEWYLKKSKQ